MTIARPVLALRRLATVAGLLLATACANQSPASGSAGASQSPIPSAATPGTLEVTAKEYSFTGPATVNAGITTISLHNAGKEIHQAQLARLNAGTSFKDLVAAVQADEPTKALALVSLAGGPTGVAAGATLAATSSLTPGSYAFLCFVDAPDGLPHVAKGMIAPIDVTGTGADAALPAGDVTVEASDFTYKLPASVSVGSHMFTLTNRGPQPHEALLVDLGR